MVYPELPNCLPWMYTAFVVLPAQPDAVIDLSRRGKSQFVLNVLMLIYPSSDSSGRESESSGEKSYLLPCMLYSRLQIPSNRPVEP
jgi:hypothetical protein